MLNCFAILLFILLLSFWTAAIRRNFSHSESQKGERTLQWIASSILSQKHFRNFLLSTFSPSLSLLGSVREESALEMHKKQFTVIENKS
jgi:hypothetical protein